MQNYSSQHTCLTLLILTYDSLCNDKNTCIDTYSHCHHFGKKYCELPRITEIFDNACQLISIRHDLRFQLSVLLDNEKSSYKIIKFKGPIFTINKEY